MTNRYGIVTPPAIGHLNPMVALALELRRRGHEVVLFTVADGARKLTGLPLEVVTIGADAFPPGAVDEAYATLGRLSGRKGLRFSVHYFRRELAMLHEELPDAVRGAGVTVLLVDQLSPAGSTVAEVLGLPFVTIANALLVNREPGVPPYFTGWFPRNGLWARWRNQLGNALLDRLSAPLWRDLQNQRRRFGLKPTRCQRCKAPAYLIVVKQLAQQPPPQTRPAGIAQTGVPADPAPGALCPRQRRLPALKRGTGEPAAVGSHHRWPQRWTAGADRNAGGDAGLYRAWPEPGRR
jgi:UDP:flavonoid glycosyltransferase YjiC (YdhE family)